MALNESLRKVMEMTGGSMAGVGAAAGAKPVIDSFGKVGRMTAPMPRLPESGAAITDREKKSIIISLLRKESGAAIAENEMNAMDQTYFPQSGDTPQVREQKRQALGQAIEQAKNARSMPNAELGQAIEQARSAGTMPRLPESGAVRRGMPMMTPESGAAINAESMPMMPRPPIPDEYNDLINFEGLPAKNANEIAAENETAQAIEALTMELQKTQDPEEQQVLMNMIENTSIKANAPYAPLIDQLSAQAGEDNMMAHVRAGDVNVSREILEANPQIEDALEKAALEFGQDPETMVYGTGIMSLDVQTGAEQHGFLKKIAKGIGKVVKKVAPIAAFIPGVGTALGGVLGGIGGIATKIPGIGGALGKLGSSAMGLVAKAGIPGISSIAGGTASGFGGIKGGLGSLKGLLGDGPLSGFLGGGSELTVQPGDTLNEIAAKNGTTVADIMKANPSITDPNMIQAGATLNMPGGGGNFNVGRAILGGEGRTPDFIKQGENLLKGEYTPGAGGPQQPGGSGGFGGMSDLLKLGGAGALAAGLGKLAFDEAKNAKGAPVTPYTTMDASGRYNIEAELARRMGQQAPNPVEFGLLPTDALPQLSGGQPRVVGAAEGGSMYPNKGLESLARVAPDVVERMGYNMGGYVMPMAYADGGDVAMEEFERKNGMINGAGTETSDDIPAMLSDGEFVMTGQAVRGAGSYNMNNDSGILTLTPNGAPGRESGTDLMYQLMEVFGNRANAS